MYGVICGASESWCEEVCTLSERAAIMKSVSRQMLVSLILTSFSRWYFR